jgi:hypothetical protein
VIIAIGVQALIAAQLGLSLGARISEHLRERAEQIAGLALILLGDSSSPNVSSAEGPAEPAEGGAPKSPVRVGTEADLSQPCHRLTGPHRTEADSLDIRRILTCGYGFCRTGRAHGIDLRIKRPGPSLPRHLVNRLG